MVRSKLSPRDQQEITRLYRGGETTTTLAEQFGVSISTVTRILKENIPADEYQRLVSQKRSAARRKETDKDSASEFSTRSKPSLNLLNDDPDPSPRRYLKPRTSVAPVESVPVPSLDPDGWEDTRTGSEEPDLFEAASDQDEAWPAAQSSRLGPQQFDPQGFAPSEWSLDQEQDQPAPRASDSTLRADPYPYEEDDEDLEDDDEFEDDEDLDDDLEEDEGDLEDDDEDLEDDDEDLDEDLDEDDEDLEDDDEDLDEDLDEDDEDLEDEDDDSEEEDDWEDSPLPLARRNLTAPDRLTSEDLDDEDLDDDLEEDEFEEDLPSQPSHQAPGVPVAQILPLEELDPPHTCYVVIDRYQELTTRPLSDLIPTEVVTSLQSQISHQEAARAQTLPIFDSHRVARRFSDMNRRSGSQPHRVIRFSGHLIEIVSPQLQSKGITHLLVDGQVYRL